MFQSFINTDGIASVLALSGPFALAELIAVCPPKLLASVLQSDLVAELLTADCFTDSDPSVELEAFVADASTWADANTPTLEMCGCD
ncbi:hypothetical protein [Pseudanabaena sp. FACHB-2040]|uniref:hypothetical protein n=1 Tax=Pseudanabaena sp. FACHB-2040 TaxID=2692859 RepID=UPI001689D633|nr:hypothetical protein [Pseudanabaena sp. FACHB-2040]MBD2256663.1 hypothetical protein [Pseudanabaena sp. FACHB-2040]